MVQYQKLIQFLMFQYQCKFIFSLKFLRIFFRKQVHSKNDVHVIVQYEGNNLIQIFSSNFQLINGKFSIIFYQNN